MVCRKQKSIEDKAGAGMPAFYFCIYIVLKLMTDIAEMSEYKYICIKDENCEILA